MDYIKPKLWKGNNLKGTWEVSLKIDGVRMLRDGQGKPISRNGKPLYNLDHIPKDISDAEIYCGNWEDTVSLVRTKEFREVKDDWVYPLYPNLDERLFLDLVKDPTADYIDHVFKCARADDYEGLVLRNGFKSIKVKSKENYDVPVIGIQPGEGKHTGRMGCLITEKGKVGTGFTDKEREEFMDIKLGTIIEVECMSLTPSGKFRHPRFVRMRFDK